MKKNKNFEMKSFYITKTTKPPFGSFFLVGETTTTTTTTTTMPMTMTTMMTVMITMTMEMATVMTTVTAAGEMLVASQDKKKHSAQTCYVRLLRKVLQ